jgi:hypothetical protein
MGKTLDEAIDELVAEIAAAEADLRKKKETVNTLCTVDGRPAAYVLTDLASSIPTKIRADQFYGQPLASAVRTILEMRRQQDLGAATNNEIYDALVAGGYQFNTKSEDVARNSLRNSLSKNTTTFHKLPNGRFGMLSWYPSAKPARASAATGAGMAGAEDSESDDDTNEEAAAESSDAAS